MASNNLAYARGKSHQKNDNTLKLKLKKPNSWNWELSTSKSSTHIEFPRVLLYDKYNNLLVDIGEADFVVNSKENQSVAQNHTSTSDISKKNHLRKSRSFSVANSVNTFERDILKNNDDSDQRQESMRENDEESIELFEVCIEKPNIPIFIYSAQGLVRRDFNAKEFDAIRNRQLVGEHDNHKSNLKNKNYEKVNESTKRSKQYSCRNSSSNKEEENEEINQIKKTSTKKRCRNYSKSIEKQARRVLLNISNTQNEINEINKDNRIQRTVSFSHVQNNCDSQISLSSKLNNRRKPNNGDVRKSASSVGFHEGYMRQYSDSCIPYIDECLSENKSFNPKIVDDVIITQTQIPSNPLSEFEEPLPTIQDQWTDKSINRNDCHFPIRTSNGTETHYCNQKLYYDEKNRHLSSTNNSKKENNDNKLNVELFSEANDYNMGSNVSRDTKRLLERRTQSSGDLSENLNEPTQMTDCKINLGNQTNAIRSQIEHLELQKNRIERNKFCGSLPSHLDCDEKCQENQTVTMDRNDHSANNEKATHQNERYERASNLKLTINRSSFDVGCDQGYGSERSPEEDFPPIFAIPYKPFPTHFQASKGISNSANIITEKDFDFIKQDYCFTVKVVKNYRGLGISVYGGIDSNVAFRGLIRIKHIFPNQSVWSTGMLKNGDILLEGNGNKLTGLTNHEALKVLRTTPNIVILKVCRPQDDNFRIFSPPTDPPRPPERSLHTNAQFKSLSPMKPHITGEFEIVMVKQNGSLGFTLRKEDESILGHYVRALVRDPAASDSRIKPGDKIVSVNDVPLSPMSHEEAVIFLRQAKDRVKLRLFRDSTQTPMRSVSPSISEQFTPRDDKPKASLRQEAMNLLIDLAHKNREQSCDSYSTGSSVQSGNTSPRRLTRNYHKNVLCDNDDENGRFISKNTNGYELNKLDNKTLDAPVYNSIQNESNFNFKIHQDPTSNDFTSLPCETTLLSNVIGSSAYEGSKFSYSNPIYQSAHVQYKCNLLQNCGDNYLKESDSKIVDDAERRMALNDMQDPVSSQQATGSVSGRNNDHKEKIITIELSRGWNSRLGFSLRSVPNSMKTIVSAIYSDSVAAKDGRLRIDDELIMVNEESVETKSTAEVIDLLRIIRGSIVLVIKRQFL